MTRTGLWACEDIKGGGDEETVGELAGGSGSALGVTCEWGPSRGGVSGEGSRVEEAGQEGLVRGRCEADHEEVEEEDDAEASNIKIGMTPTGDRYVDLGKKRRATVNTFKGKSVLHMHSRARRHVAHTSTCRWKIPRYTRVLRG